LVSQIILTNHLSQVTLYKSSTLKKLLFRLHHVSLNQIGVAIQKRCKAEGNTIQLFYVN